MYITRQIIFRAVRIFNLFGLADLNLIEHPSLRAASSVPFARYHRVKSLCHYFHLEDCRWHRCFSFHRLARDVSCKNCTSQKKYFDAIAVIQFAAMCFISQLLDIAGARLLRPPRQSVCPRCFRPLTNFTYFSTAGLSKYYSWNYFENIPRRVAAASLFGPRVQSRRRLGNFCFRTRIRNGIANTRRKNINQPAIEAAGSVLNISIVSM